jgi:hypothetical protein
LLASSGGAACDKPINIRAAGAKTLANIERELRKGFDYMSPKEARYVPKTAIAAANIRLGEHNQAFEVLEKAVAEKNGGLVELKVAPLFEPPRPHTKFKELLRRVGLAQ